MRRSAGYRAVDVCRVAEEWRSVVNLKTGEFVVVVRYGQVVIESALAAPLAVDVQQRNRGRVILDQTHVRRYSHDARNRKTEETPGGLLFKPPSHNIVQQQTLYAFRRASFIVLYDQCSNNPGTTSNMR